MDRNVTQSVEKRTISSKERTLWNVNRSSKYGPMCADQHCASVRPCQAFKCQQHVDRLCGKHEEVSRLALILTENRFTEEPSVTNVKDILTNSGFRVESNVLGNYAQDIISFVPDEICRSTVQQLIIIVIANAQYPKCMDDFLKLMTDGGFFDLQKRFLLFCRVSNGNENTSDLQLQRKFSSNSFKYKSAIVGYKFDAEEKIRNFINWLAQEMNTCWNNSCLSAMLSRWLPAHDEEDLYMYPTGKCKRPFLRDILFHLDNREQQEGNGPMAAGAEGPMAAAAESPMNATVDNDQIASLIYPNKRTPTKPQALIILYFNKSAAPCESLQADCLRLMKLFKFRLGYLVTDIQVDSESQNDLEDRVKSFANQQDHGDSCVLIILSLSNGLLCGHSIINLFSQMSLSKQLKGKPRLFLLNEWQSGAQTGRLADPASPSEAFEILPDTVSSMEDYWGTRNETSKVHPFSGMVFGLASANNETDVDGSDFVRTLCTTFEKFGSTKDVVSMSAIINEELSVSAKALPRWIIQTTKLFFITNTGGLETTSQKVSPNGPQDNACTSERNKAGRTGVALIFTEYLFDAVRNYQTFLEYASFKVHVDRTRGDVESLRKAFDCEKDHFQKDLVVIVVVRQRHSDGDLWRIIRDIGIARSTEARHSILLIYCEVYDTEESSQRELQVARQVENLPDKFSMACFFGNEEEVKEFLDSLLQDARMSESLNGISVVGRNFQDGRTSQRENFVFKRNDEIPKWATGRVIKWLGNYTIKSSVQRSTTAQDDTVQSEVVVDEFRLSETRKRWHPKLPPAIESTSECVRAPRALIVHNVIFKEKLSARLGSQHDCQRLTESLLRLGYKVSIRSNLNGAEIKHEVKKFSEESDDGRSSVVAFMSHGRLGEVFGSDEEPVGEKDVLQLFSDESGTKDNFQLAIFQCCRVPGQLPDEVSCLAFYPGMIIAHSTLPNDFSLRVKSKGSRFIQSFCTVLDLFPHNDIVTIIPLVNYLMLNSIYQGFSQQPWWFVQSGKRFWPKVQGAGENSQNPSECNNAFDLQELQIIIESDHQD